MRILLVDADSTIPNLALMRISTYHKSQGDQVEFMRLSLSYYPNRKNKPHVIPVENYDKVYCSCIFTGTRRFVIGEGIIFGGTGIDLTTKIPGLADECEPDYSLYPDCDRSYGFISRGCNRNCYFCGVPEKEGRVRVVDTIDRIIRHPKVEFLDNNFLQILDHKAILSALAERQIPCRFMQGLDIRMVDPENSKLLYELNYIGEYIFAFDDAKYAKLIASKLDIMKWRKPWQFKFYIYVHPGMDLTETAFRVNWLRERHCLPYIMRDLACWDSDRANFFTDLAAWCNQPGLFKNMEFSEFLWKRHTNMERSAETLLTWGSACRPLTYAKKTFIQVKAIA